MSLSVGVVIPTYKSRPHLRCCLPPLLASPLSPCVLVVDSTSEDGTVEEAKRLGAETLVIPKHLFNHGLTRELARKRLAADIVVMVTPDAYAKDHQVLQKLVEPICSGQASLAYARQYPRPHAPPVESFLRLFNYPEKSHIRNAQESDLWGVYLFFCSNSFAAWSQKALDEIGGFQATLTAEDTFAAARLLRKGHRIAYVAEAIVYHSHRHSLRQEFKRYFDTGYVREQHADLLDFGCTDAQRGREYVRKLTRYVWQRSPWHLPYAWANIMVKWLGYQLGRRADRLPKAARCLLSAHPDFWAN